MAEIIPNSSIRVMFGVPLNSHYDNTFYFYDKAQQTRYFVDNFQSKLYTEQYYTRRRRGWLRINDTYDNVYNANYLYFVNVSRQVNGVANPPYENKGYYAFIDDVVYINDHTCEIHYTIDVLQTYMFDWVFEDVFVERETTASDLIGEHLIDEGLPIGDYVNNFSDNMLFDVQNSEDKYPLSAFEYLVAATVDIDYKDTTDGAEICHSDSGIISGCKLLRFTELHDDPNDTSIKGILDWLNDLPGEKQNAILAIYLCPKSINTSAFGGTAAHAKIQKRQERIGSPNDEYIPLNKKLLSSPYNNLMIQSSDGNSIIYDYSKFPGSSISEIEFDLFYIYTFPVQGILVPKVYYKGENYPARYGLPLPMLPTCTWANDTFKAWAALNTGYVVSSIAGSVVDAGIKIAAAYFGGQAIEAAGTVSFDSAIYTEATSNYWTTQLSDAAVAKTNAEKANLQGQTIGGIFGDVRNITNNLIAINNARIQPDSFNGSAQNLLSAGARYYGFNVSQYCVRADYARTLDCYFTMFGYKVNTIKKPVLRQRTRYTYIKTSNMNIHGNIPNTDVMTICAIFNRGIRWWIDREHIGEYRSTITGELIANPPAVIEP